MSQCNSDKTKADTDAEQEQGSQSASATSAYPPGQQSPSAVIRFVESTEQLDQWGADGVWRYLWSDASGGTWAWRSLACALEQGISAEIFFNLLAMDWTQWSLVASPAGSAWPAVPPEFSETLALSTALSCSLLACEKCMLTYCFDPVSTFGGPVCGGLAYASTLPVSVTVS